MHVVDRLDVVGIEEELASGDEFLSEQVGEIVIEIDVGEPGVSDDLAQQPWFHRQGVLEKYLVDDGPRGKSEQLGKLAEEVEDVAASPQAEIGRRADEALL